jgi:DNA-binding NarL/FixJ family response regulator
MIKVAIVDDHAMFVDGIESILAHVENIDLVAKCHQGADIFAILESSKIDVLLLDINLPDMNGIELCKRITSEYNNTLVLALSMYNEESFVTEILKNGAKGYILKNTGRAELIKAIETIASGENFFSKDVTETIMSGLIKSPGPRKSKFSVAPKLTRREKEVLSLIVKEYTTQDIANTLFISLKTVETHRSSLISKLNVKNSAGLVRAAYEQKLI